jgi:hypothetical protein
MQHVISNAVSGTVIAKANGLFHCGGSGEESTHGIIFFCRTASAYLRQLTQQQRRHCCDDEAKHNNEKNKLQLTFNN